MPKILSISGRAVSGADHWRDSADVGCTLLRSSQNTGEYQLCSYWCKAQVREGWIYPLNGTTLKKNSDTKRQKTLGSSSAIEYITIVSNLTQV